MGLQVIGAGVGRTGTYSLKLAINQLGFGPCHHMEEVLLNMPVQTPLWSAALKGQADWETIFDGYKSTVDWPTAAFVPELYEAYPNAKFVLTHRSPESWVDSFSATIYEALGQRDQAPPERKDWLEMAYGVIEKTGFPEGLDRDALSRAFVAHNESVKALIPADQLLVFQVKEGWEPLCRFLDVPIPEGSFPRTNDRAEFWDRLSDQS